MSRVFSTGMAEAVNEYYADFLKTGIFTISYIIVNNLKVLIIRISLTSLCLCKILTIMINN